MSTLRELDCIDNALARVDQALALLAGIDPDLHVASNGMQVLSEAQKGLHIARAFYLARRARLTGDTIVE